MEESGQTTVSLQKRHNFVHLGPCQAEKVKENIFPSFQKSESASADGKRSPNWRTSDKTMGISTQCVDNDKFVA
jgi:hypothetical protein